MRLSLRAKLLMLIAGTVTGLSAILLLGLMALTAREIDRSVRANVRATGRTLEQMMRERNTAQKSQCSMFARQPVLKALLGVKDSTDPTLETSAAGTAQSELLKPDDTTVTDSLREYLREMGADAALLTDRNGRRLGYASRFETSEHTIVPEGFVREPGVVAAKQGESWSGVLERGDSLSMAVSVPVTINQEVWGTFTAYHTIGAGEVNVLKGILGSEIVFVHNKKVTFSSVAMPSSIPTPEDAPRILTWKEGRYFALYAPLPDTPQAAGMGFVTLLPYDRAMALSYRLRTAFLLASFVALGLALAAGTALSRSLTRPLDGVVSAARTLREGQWPEPFFVRRTDEIGLLQSVFNEMSTGLRENQDRLLALLDTDLLTGLDNHRRFKERLEQEVARCATSGEALSLLLLDLDHFQAYNQRLGHASGDDALQRIAQILRVQLPDLAVAARYGGEEFAILLPQHALDEAERLGEKIRSAVEEAGTQGEPLTLSIGCAELGTQTQQAEGLALAAELAVVRAKQMGRNRVCRFDSMAGTNEEADPYQLQNFLKDGSLATIQALAAAVDAKDPYTKGHSQRVADYAADLARHLGMSDAEIKLILITGTLHDVGKIGVPDSVLNKPGRLTDDERAVMETHPVLGEVIVRKAPQLEATLPGVLHHHERWDGRGYPHGLEGEAIPYIARILAVADSYDAMTSDRPYRKGLAVEIALSEITKGAGTQFDPDLAPAFVTMMSAHCPEFQQQAA